MQKKLCPLLPLELDEEKKFVMIDHPAKAATQKLKTLLLTNPGEKILDYNFGIGIKKILFETIKDGKALIFSEDKQTTRIDVQKAIGEKLDRQIKIYMPEITRYEFRISKLNNDSDGYKFEIGFVVDNLLKSYLSLNILG